jgi:hypothetical protein
VKSKGRRREVVDCDRKRREKIDVALPREGAMAGMKRDHRYNTKPTTSYEVLSHLKSLQSPMTITSIGHVGSDGCLQNT